MPWSQFETQAELDEAVGKWINEEDRLAMQAAGPTSTTAEQLTETFLDEEEHDNTVIGDAFRSGNIGLGLYNSVERTLAHEPDPDFHLRDHFETITNGIDPMYWDEFSEVRSLPEAEALKAEIETELKAQRHLMSAGASGMGALLIAGVMDVDLPLMFLSGGESLVAKMGLQGTKMGKWFAKSARARRIFGASSAGAMEGAAIGVADAMVHPTSSLAHLPQMVFANSIMSGGISGLTKTGRKVNESIEDAMQGMPNLHSDPRLGMDRMFNTAGENEHHVVFGAANVEEAADRFMQDVKKTSSKSPMADSFLNLLQKSPLQADFDRLFNSKSSIAQAISYEVFESPSGIVRNNRTSAMLDHMYTNRITQAVVPEHVNAFKEWAHEQGGTLMDIHWDDKLYRKFNREVYIELQRRYHGDPVVHVHPSIKRAADAADEAGAAAVNVGKGEFGEIAMDGFETLEPRSGFIRQIWKANGVSAAIKKYGEERVLALLDRGYAKVHINLKPDELRMLSNAVVRRSQSNARDIDTSLMSLLTRDGRQFLQEALEESGVPNTKAKSIVEAMAGPIEERGKASYAKHRTDIDLRETDGELSLLDLVETDHVKIWSHYARDVGGRAGLARKGIKNKAQLSDLFNKILKQDGAAGGTLTKQFLEEVFTHFEPGPIAGGVGPNVRRMIQTTNLSLLNQIGLPQCAETGVLIAAVGVEDFIAHSPVLKRVFKNARGGRSDHVLDEFTVLTGRIGEEHNLMRDDLAMDYARADTKQYGKILSTLDKALAKGQRLQGFTSFFYKVKEAQQRIAVSAMSDKVMRTLRDGEGISKRRLSDIGLDSATLQRLKKYIDNGTVEFMDNGSVDRLNMDKWNITDSEDFALAMTRFTHQTVQRAMAGESTTWMHKDVGAIFTHLQQFPLLAMQKQVIRNARIMDQTTAMMFMYGLGTASLAYTAKQVINGRTDRLDAEHIAKGAFGLSNMTGWIPMWSDPLASMLGMNDLRFNNYGPRVGAPILEAPAVTTMQRLTNLPGALVPDGKLDYNDIAAMKAVPILGNMYGMSMMFDAMRD